MKLFSNIRAKRNTAFLVLLMWLFSLASGVANACLLEARGTHAHLVTVGLSETVNAPHVSPGHAGAVAGHDDDSQASKATCLKVCDDGARSVPKQDLTVAQTDPGPAPLVAVLWTAPHPSFRRPVEWIMCSPRHPSGRSGSATRDWHSNRLLTPGPESRALRSASISQSRLALCPGGELGNHPSASASRKHTVFHIRQPTRSLP